MTWITILNTRDTIIKYMIKKRRQAQVIDAFAKPILKLNWFRKYGMMIWIERKSPYLVRQVGRITDNLFALGSFPF